MNDTTPSVRPAPQDDAAHPLDRHLGKARKLAVHKRQQLNDRPDRACGCHVGKVPTPEASQAECRRFESGHPLSGNDSPPANLGGDNHAGRASSDKPVTEGAAVGTRERSTPPPTAANRHPDPASGGGGLRGDSEREIVAIIRAAGGGPLSARVISADCETLTAHRCRETCRELAARGILEVVREEGRRVRYRLAEGGAA